MSAEVVMPAVRSGRGARRVAWLIVLALVAIGVSIFALTSGSVDMSAADVLNILREGADRNDTAAVVVFELRLPRILAGLAVGAALGLAGAKMQVLIRNPLADPYVLGISGGAAVGALGAMLMGQSHVVVQIAAGLGAIASMLIVLGIGRGIGQWSSTRLLLTGVVVASGWGAVVSFMLAIGPSMQLKGMLFWLMGDLALATPNIFLTVTLGICLVIGLLMARAMNLLATGELQAAALGVDVRRMRMVLYLSASILTACAVTVAGSIGFVGLVVPHMMRLIGGADHRWVVPASALSGAILVVLADTLARTVAAPQQLPVGVLTAFAGVPVFLYLLWRGGRERGS